MTFYIVPIIEGQTEASCIERLLQRVWQMLTGPTRLQVLRPSRGNRDALVHANGIVLAQKIGEAHAKLSQGLHGDPQSRGLLLLLLDAENDCPAQLAPRLLQTARQARSDADIVCILAKRMLENWIMAGASTLANVNGLPAILQLPHDLESHNGVKWLAEQLRKRNKARKYKKPTDATAFIAAMDLAQCRKNASSFDKLCRELATRLLPPPVAQPHSPDSDEPVAKA